MDSFTWTLNYPAKLSREPKVQNINFGDGYSQRTPLGLNSSLQNWDVQADKS